MSSSLSEKILRTAGIFQGLVAAPTLIVMSNFLFWYLFDVDYRYYSRIYDFITATFNAVMSGFILFIVLIQRHRIKSHIIRLYLEITKSVCATAVWLWLLLDSIFRGRTYYSRPVPDRTPRIVLAALCVVVLLFLFYPTLVFTIVEQRFEEEETREGEAAEGAGERTPLLRA